NLGPEINTGGDEKAPLIAPNGVDLYFSSTGHPGLGGYDLFRSTNVKGETWSLARNVGKPFNSGADDIFWRLTAREDTVIIASSRGGGYGELDMYAVWPNPFKDSTRYIFYVRGMVYDSITEMGIPNANVRVEPAQGSAFTLEANHNGRYEFRTELARSYRIATSVKGYEPAEKQFTVPEFLYYNEYRQSLPLTPVGVKRAAEEAEEEEEEPGELPDDVVVSYFGFDKSALRPEYQEELKAYYKAEISPLQEAGTEFTITLDAHTDDRGSEDYNINLSRRRGAAVSKFLRDLGVPLEAIRINAYGENRPASLGDSKVSHAMNRRVELQLSTR
ncbi:MAG: OmpA family protein, partial [Bacteroidetes bacterium]|nr:OmpA family protein [Bacteroidota bacterium]